MAPRNIQVNHVTCSPVFFVTSFFVSFNIHQSLSIDKIFGPLRLSSLLPKIPVTILIPVIRRGIRGFVPIAAMSSSSKPAKTTKRSRDPDAPISPPPLKRKTQSGTTSKNRLSLGAFSHANIPQRMLWPPSSHRSPKSHHQRSSGRNVQRTTEAQTL